MDSKIIFSEKINDIISSAEKGNIDDMYRLANYYREIQDYEKMNKYYLMAIENNSIVAMNEFGTFCYHTHNKNKSKNERLVQCNDDVKEKLENMAKSENKDIIIFLGRYNYYHHNYEKMHKYYLIAIESGDVNAMVELGQIYYYMDKWNECEKYLFMAHKNNSKKALTLLAKTYGRLYFMLLEQMKNTSKNIFTRVKQRQRSQSPKSPESPEFDAELTSKVSESNKETETANLNNGRVNFSSFKTNHESIDFCEKVELENTFLVDGNYKNQTIQNNNDINNVHDKLEKYYMMSFEHGNTDSIIFLCDHFERLYNACDSYTKLLCERDNLLKAKCTSKLMDFIFETNKNNIERESTQHYGHYIFAENNIDELKKNIFDKMMKYYEIAFDAGIAYCMYALGNFYKFDRNYEKAKKCYQMAIKSEMKQREKERYEKELKLLNCVLEEAHKKWGIIVGSGQMKQKFDEQEARALDLLKNTDNQNIKDNIISNIEHDKKLYDERSQLQWFIDHESIFQT